MRVRRRPADAVTAVGAAALAGLCGWAASSGTVGAVERRVFELVNDRPEAWRTPMWGFQLLGLLGTPLVVAIGALVLR